MREKAFSFKTIKKWDIPLGIDLIYL